RNSEMGTILSDVPDPPLSGPELSVTGLSLGNNYPISGNHTNLSIAIYNGGESPTGKFKVRCIPYYDAPPSEVISETIEIGPKTKKYVELPYAWKTPGNHQIRVIADAENVVKEQKEGNNVRTRDIIVYPKSYEVSLDITKVELPGGLETRDQVIWYQAGSKAEVSFTINGFGNAPTQKFRINPGEKIALRGQIMFGDPGAPYTFVLRHFQMAKLTVPGFAVPNPGSKGNKTWHNETLTYDGVYNWPWYNTGNTAYYKISYKLKFRGL
ncbi:MAG: hypothetical protein KDD99_24440, partial [Bacteroidetes bacterium]|nr:hypothetical protein [Bacteroidota bacterium]